MAFGSTVAADLQTIGVRNVFHLIPMAEHPSSRLMVLTRVWPDAASLNDANTATDALYKTLLDGLRADIHARRLLIFWNVMVSLIQSCPDEPFSYAVRELADGPRAIESVS
jgi:hypothetical protein